MILPLEGRPEGVEVSVQHFQATPVVLLELAPTLDHVDRGTSCRPGLREKQHPVLEIEGCQSLFFGNLDAGLSPSDSAGDH